MSPVVGFVAGYIGNSVLLGFIVTIGLVVFGLFCIWIGATARAPIRQRNEAWAKYSDITRIDLVLKYEKPRPPYVENDYVNDSEARDGHRLFRRLYRIAVTASKARTIDGVVVDLMAFEPQGASFLPQPLHPMGAGFDASASAEFRLDPEQTAYVDVVSWVPQQPEGKELAHPNHSVWSLHYHQPQMKALPTMLQPGKYRLVIQARARDIQPVRAEFEFGLTNDEPFFRQIMPSTPHIEGKKR